MRPIERIRVMRLMTVRTLAAFALLMTLVVSGAAQPVSAAAAPATCWFNRTATHFGVSWTAVSGATEYVVRRSVGPVDSPSEPYWRKVSPAGSTSTTDLLGPAAGDPAPTDPIQYFVASKDAGGESALTACKLLAPTGFTATAQGSGTTPSVSFGWAANPDADEFRVYLSGDPVPFAVAARGSTGIVVTGDPAAFTQPSWTVVAVSRDRRNGGNVAVESGSSNVDTAPGTTTLQAATGDAEGELVLSWSAVADATSGYKIYRDGSFVQLVAAPATSVTIAGGVPLGSHSWTVRATAIGNYHAAASNSITVGVSDTTRPSTPTGLAVVNYPTTSSVSLSWNESSDASGVAGYRVYRMVGASPAASDPLLASPTTRTAIVSAIASGWQVYVKAIDTASPGNLSWSSNRVTLSPSAQIPQPPTQATISGISVDRRVSMTWPLVAGATSYDVYRDLADAEINAYNNNGTPLPTAKRVGAGVVVGAFTDPTSLTAGTTHTWTVVAKNASGASDLSPKASATICDRLTSPTSRWRTAMVCGTWQLLNGQGYIDQFEAVNIKGESITLRQPAPDDIAALAGEFQSVRLSLVWKNMQPVNSTSLDSDWEERVLALLEELRINQVAVILDPVHLSGGDDFGIPAWAWQSQLPNVTPAKNQSYPVWADNGANQNNGQRVKDYLQVLADAGILTHDAVVGIEVVNEPHPRPNVGGATSSLAKQQLATTYNSIAGFIRDHPNPAINQDLVILGSYHGGTRLGGNLTGTTFTHPVHMATVSNNYRDIMWTAHNYYTGTGDSFGINDGLRPDGGLREGFWVEGATTDAGCYADGARVPDIEVEWNCPATPDRSAALIGHRNNASGHWLYAQQAGMPFFMGEWGAPRQRRLEVSDGAGGTELHYLGLDGSEMMYCDKLAAYQDPKADGDTTRDAISWAVWSFDAAVDGYGLYNASDVAIEGNVAKSYLPIGEWAVSGTFPNNPAQGLWAGDPWTYALPFTSATFCG